MATNLTTIEVRLQANAQKFKQNIKSAGSSLKNLKKTTTGVSAGGAVRVIWGNVGGSARAFPSTNTGDQ